MNQSLRKAIEAVIHDAGKCSTDEHGYLQHMDGMKMAHLVIEYDKDCRKHGRSRVRLSGGNSSAKQASASA